MTTPSLEQRAAELASKLIFGKETEKPRPALQATHERITAAILSFARDVQREAGPRWIPVTERLPELLEPEAEDAQSETVLVCTLDGYVFTTTLQRALIDWKGIGLKKGDLCWDGDMGAIKLDRVAYWQKIVAPEAPHD